MLLCEFHAVRMRFCMRFCMAYTRANVSHKLATPSSNKANAGLSQMQEPPPTQVAVLCTLLGQAIAMKTSLISLKHPTLGQNGWNYCMHLCVSSAIHTCAHTRTQTNERSQESNATPASPVLTTSLDLLQAQRALRWPAPVALHVAPWTRCDSVYAYACRMLAHTPAGYCNNAILCIPTVCVPRALVALFAPKSAFHYQIRPSTDDGAVEGYACGGRPKFMPLHVFPLPARVATNCCDPQTACQRASDSGRPEVAL